MKKMCKLSMAFLMVFMFLIPHAFAGIGADGTLYLKDINADNQVGLHDIIYQMQLLTGMRHLKYVSEADATGQIVVVSESGTIQGVVTEDTGDAEVFRIIPDALIVCVSETGERFTLKSADDGSFRFEGLQAGQHVLAVSQQGFYPARIKVEVEPETVARVDVKLKKMGNVNGKVAGHVFRPGLEGQLKPLPGVTVSILTIPDNMIDEITTDTEKAELPIRKILTDDSGAYVLDGIPEGRYFVMGNKAGFQKVMSIVSIVGGATSKRNMVLFPELSEETGALMGKVVEKAPHITANAWETYYPVKGARVSLVIVKDGTVSEIVQSVVSNEKGIFSFVDIPVGEYTLAVTHEKFEDYHQQVVIKPRFGTQLPVLNPNGALIEIDGEKSNSDDSQLTYSDPAKSAYDFLNLIQNLGSGCFCIDPYMNWHQDTQFVRVVLTRNELPQKAMISGQVLTVDGDDNNNAVKKPVPGAKVVAVPYFPYPTLTASGNDADADYNFAPLPTFETETNENGYYEFKDLPVGYFVDGNATYIVAVDAPNFASSKEKVNVIPGEMVEHNVILHPEGVIATLSGLVSDGSVKCDDGSEKCFAPIESADVSLFPITYAGDILPAIQGIHVTTGPDGKYFFPRLAAIEYQMIVNAEKYTSFRQTIKLQPGENKPIDVTLEPLEQIVRVKGVVLTKTECSDGMCEKPVPGAIVYAYPVLTESTTTDDHLAKTYTDEKGVFRFFNAPEGKYHVIISAQGFEKFEDMVHVPSEGILELKYYIEPVTAQGRLKGHVFNGAANCVGTNCITNIFGAEITLLPIFATDPNMNIEPLFHTITNERGYYMFEKIPAGKYQITARADMFKPWEGFISIPPGAETVQDITLLPENDISALKGHVYVGNATTDQMTPVPNASVILISMKNATWIAPARTETDEKGQYYFKDMPSGEYELTVRADKYQPFETHIFIPAGETLEKNVFLEHFVGEAMLKGMVRDGSVRCDTNTERCILPIPGAHIQLYFLTPDSSTQIPNLETTSDENGLYKLLGIPTGEYVMKVWADGYQERKDTIQIKELDNEIDILLFPMTPIAHLKGQILDGLVDCDDGTDCIIPVPKSRIELIPELGINNVHPYYTESDDHGFYEFMDIPSGRYTIHIKAEKYQERTEGIDIREGENKRNFELIPAILCETNLDCSKSEFCSKPTGECEGDGICRPRPEACPENENPVCGCDGNTYSNECKAIAAGINVLYPGQCRPEPEYGILKGTIYIAKDTASTNANNTPQPIAGADIYLVQLLSSDETYPAEEFKTQSNDDGSYAFEKLPVGKYTIIVRAYGYQAWKGELGIVQNEPTIKDVYLVPFSAEASLKGIVNGIVRECEDATATTCLKPIGDALIILAPLNLTTELPADGTLDNMIEAFKTRTDDSGQYVFESLKSGEYNMRVEAAGWDVWEHPIKILPGKENNIDIELDPLAERAILVGMVRNGGVDCDSNLTDCSVGIPGALVMLYPNANDTPLQSMTAITDDSGQFKIDNLPVIRYTITIEAERFEPQKMEIDLTPGRNEKDFELMPIRQCKDNSECDADTFCKKEVGACDNDAGICTPRPLECLMIYSPVCGCNERSYGNECIANSFGMNLWYKGECRSDQE